jgi:hypothetical protein
MDPKGLTILLNKPAQARAVINSDVQPDDMPVWESEVRWNKDASGESLYDRRLVSTLLGRIVRILSHMIRNHDQVGSITFKYAPARVPPKSLATRAKEVEWSDDICGNLREMKNRFGVLWNGVESVQIDTFVYATLSTKTYIG